MHINVYSMQRTTSDFNRNSIPVQIKLAALWTSVTLCYLYADYFELYVPAKVDGIINGVSILNSPAKLFYGSSVVVYPGCHGIPFNLNRAAYKPDIKHCLRAVLYRCDALDCIYINNSLAGILRVLCAAGKFYYGV